MQRAEHQVPGFCRRHGRGDRRQVAHFADEHDIRVLTQGTPERFREVGHIRSDFALHDQNGDLIQLSKLRGTVVVLTPLYTHCQDLCPLTAQQIRGALDDLTGDQRNGVRALALSVDPANDTADSARRFLVERRVSGYLDFLLGAQSELRPIWRDYGFAPQTKDQTHNSYVVLIDKRGRQRVGFPIDHLTPEDLAHDIRVLLTQRA